MASEKCINLVVEKLNNEFRQSECGYLSLGEILMTLPKVDKIGCWTIDTEDARSLSIDFTLKEEENERV